MIKVGWIKCRVKRHPASIVVWQQYASGTAICFRNDPNFASGKTVGTKDAQIVLYSLHIGVNIFTVQVTPVTASVPLYEHGRVDVIGCAELYSVACGDDCAKLKECQILPLKTALYDQRYVWTTTCGCRAFGVV